MALKWQIERAVFRDVRGDPSRAWMLDVPPLAANDRLVMCALLSRADVDTATINDEHTPSLSELAELTGLDRSTVRRSLNRLEAAKWVVRDRPDPVDARSKGARTCYRLALPPKIEKPVEDDEVGADSPQGRGTTPPPKRSKVGAPRPQGRGTQPPLVGAQRPQGRGHVPPIPLPTPVTTKSRPKHTSAHEPEQPTQQPNPTPTRTPGLAPALASSTRAAALVGAADELVDEYAATFRNPVPRKTRGQLLIQIDTLITEGFSCDQIRAGLALLRQRPRLGPGVLPNLVHEAINTAGQGRRPAPNSTFARSGDALAASRARLTGARPDLVILEGELA